MRKRLILIGLSIIALAILWWKTGWTDLYAACRTLDGPWFFAAVLMFIPQTWLSGMRWSWIVGAWQPLGVWRATELVLASSSLNVILPSKMGDVVKGLFLRRDLPGGDIGTGVTLGLFEKGLDTAALAAVMLCATCAAPPDDALGWFLVGSAAFGVLAFLALLTRPVATWLGQFAITRRPGIAGRLLRLLGIIGSVVLALRRRRGRFITIMVSALILWGLHLAQFSIFVHAAGGSVSMAMLWSRVPMAIFVGLLPLTFAGVGTRDAAMVLLLGGAVGRGVALALGMFATLRYVIVALAGLPFVLRLPIDRASLLRRPEAAPIAPLS